MAELNVDPMKRSSIYATFGRYYGEKLYRLLYDCANCDGTFCKTVMKCLGISPQGNPSLYLNQTGTWTNPAFPVFEMLYSEFLTKLNSGTLIPGSKILITDYQTVHYIQFSGTGPGGIGGEIPHAGTPEQLLVTVTSPSSISPMAESLSYPQDIIHYVPDVMDGFYDGLNSSNGGKGVITYREDTLNQVARDYDWRNVVFWRWETSVGNGNYWSVQPVSGASHIEIGCFWNTGGLQNVYIKSPLAANQFLNGSPYWLDNFVINVGNGCIGLQVNIAYGSTYSEYTEGAGELGESNYNSIAYDTVICDSNTNNQINVSGLNFVNLGQGAFQNNNIGTFQNNNIIDTNIGIITGNIISVCYQNTINQLQYNSGSLLLGNNNNGDPINIIGNQGFAFITNNVCSQILGNITDTISDNTCAKLSGNISNSINSNMISGNIQNNIANNINYNTSGGDIINNTIGNLIENNSNSGGILNNVGSIIQNNTNSGDIGSNNVVNITNNTNVGNITNNFGVVIDTNSNTGEINENQVDEITNNTNAGFITNNIGIIINSNSNTNSIFENNVYVISSNSNAGVIRGNSGITILGNTCGSISSNIVGRLDNNIAGDITENVGVQLSGNTVSEKIQGNNSFYLLNDNNISGQIVHNNCTYILSNTITAGNIASNVGNSISENQVARGINQNNCNLIDSNVMVGNIANNQYNIIANNTLTDITNSTGNKFFNNSGQPCIDIVGSVQNCDITAEIQSHNFIDEVISFTINPSADMQTTTPTKSMYDEVFGQHYLALLSSGAFTFPTQITV